MVQTLTFNENKSDSVMEVFGIKPKKFFELVKDMGYFFIKTSGMKSLRRRPIPYRDFSKVRISKNSGCRLQIQPILLFLELPSNLWVKDYKMQTKTRVKK